MRDHRDYVIAALAAALLFCLGLMAGRQLSILPSAVAQGSGDSGSGNNRAFGPEAAVGQPGGGGGGVTIQPSTPGDKRLADRVATPTPTNSDSNNRFIAVTCPVGSGEAVLFLIDSYTEQVTVYRYRRNKGLEFLAGRRIEFDLKITGYQDISEFSYDEMRGLFQRQVAKAAAKAAKKK